MNNFENSSNIIPPEGHLRGSTENPGCPVPCTEPSGPSTAPFQEPGTAQFPIRSTHLYPLSTTATFPSLTGAYSAPPTVSYPVRTPGPFTAPSPASYSGLGMAGAWSNYQALRPMISFGVSNLPVTYAGNLPVAPRKQRRERTTYNKDQLSIMETYFEKQAYPDIFGREELALKVGVQESRIQVWFKNRRAKEKAKKAQAGGNQTKTQGGAARAPTQTRRRGALSLKKTRSTTPSTVVASSPRSQESGQQTITPLLTPSSSGSTADPHLNSIEELTHRFSGVEVVASNQDGVNFPPSTSYVDAPQRSPRLQTVEITPQTIVSTATTSSPPRMVTTNNNPLMATSAVPYVHQSTSNEATYPAPVHQQQQYPNWYVPHSGYTYHGHPHGNLPLAHNTYQANPPTEYHNYPNGYYDEEAHNVMMQYHGHGPHGYNGYGPGTSGNGM
ncbi:homeobox protein OTX1 B-like [Euwallacea similis]|uniref:homeobox protein OTX1 B-like n=1 Tax=Euwallacea similis TaxID=1736056 RepID=UPI00344DA210